MIVKIKYEAEAVGAEGTSRQTYIILQYFDWETIGDEIRVKYGTHDAVVYYDSDVERATIQKWVRRVKRLYERKT